MINWLPLMNYLYLDILALFLHPSPPSQWLVRVPLVIMLPQLTQGLPLPYGCNNSIVRRRPLTIPSHYARLSAEDKVKY